MLNIISKEIKELLRDGRFKTIIVISLILLVFASITGLHQYKKDSGQYIESVLKERTIWETQEAKNPHSAAHYGTYAFKPMFALSLFDSGVNKYTGNSIFLEAHNRNEALYSEASDQTSLTRFGTLSINFIFIYLFPLIIILTGYNSLTKERENQTLNIIKSQGLRPAKLVLSKWLVTLLPVVLISLVIFSLIGIILSNLEGLTFFSWASLFALFISYLVYFLFISTITVLISIFSRSSGISLLTSLLFWITISFITPKIATNFANETHPYPSKSEFLARISQDKKNGLDGHNPWNDAAKSLESEILKEYGVLTVGELPFNYRGLLMQKGEEFEARVYEKHYNSLKEISNRQDQIYKNLSLLSPFISLRLLSMSISNTGNSLHWKFTEAAEDYRIMKQQFLNFDIKDNSNYNQRGYKMAVENFKKLPRFDFQPPAIDEIIRENSENLISLFVWVAVSFLILIFFSQKI